MRARLDQLDRTFREQGYTVAMVEEARQLAAELGIDPPAWAAPRWAEPNVEERRVDARDHRKRKRDEQLRHEWERWRHRRSKLPREKRGRMMENGERQCRYCDGFFVPATLRQRHCTAMCRKLAHKRAA